MKVIKTEVFNFNELSDEAKQVALSKFYDINVDCDWWTFVYEDAKETANIKITSFDIDRGSYCNISFIYSGLDTAEKIINNHGQDCQTYKTSKEYLKEYNLLVEKYSDGINKDTVKDGSEYDFDNDAEELENDFNKSIGEDYLKILRNEYEYLTSEEAIKGSIIENDYFFTKDGKRFN